MQATDEQRDDYRSSAVGRRRSWYGTKKHVKRVLGWRVPNLVMRGAVNVLRPDLRRTGRLPAPAALREVVGIVDESRFVMLRPSMCVIAKELYWGHGRRPQAGDDFAVRLVAAVARHSDVLFDIGAYTGLFTLVGTAVNDKLRAHTFEIVPEVYRALFDNVVRNRVLDRTTLHHVGVGDPETTITMPVASGDSALPSFYSASLSFNDGIPIAVRSWDSFADEVPAGSRVVVKIDVEGTEDDVFRHGQRFLAEHRPDMLCEVLHEHADGAELAALLKPHGYRFHLVREHDLAPAGELVPDQVHRDWFFTTRGEDELTAMGIEIGER
ncbi:FkbM family methyltransferase [Allonocardiopsis opalescens]|uniref:FkbM family methyltransferase n=1 Tax=Allonocardiopsis opalescens TaxID=1144618 RepID=A0A2T0QF86_9ACTN|nr:FkbM family methyltransferase [Allonocardiopsis opalescens]